MENKTPFTIYKEFSKSDIKIKLVDIPVNTELWRYIFLLNRNNIEYEIKVYPYGISIETEYCIALYNRADGNFSRYSYKMK